MTATSRFARWVHRHRLTLWIVAFTVGCTWSLFAGWRTDIHHRQLVQREAHEDVLEEAQRCVTSWTAREQIRDAVERGTRGGARVGAESIIGVATDADPERVAQFRELIDRNADAEVAAARSEIPDPDCDLAAAQRTLKEP